MAAWPSGASLGVGQEVISLAAVGIYVYVGIGIAVFQCIFLPFEPSY